MIAVLPISLILLRWPNLRIFLIFIASWVSNLSNLEPVPEDMVAMNMCFVFRSLHYSGRDCRVKVLDNGN